MLLMCAMLLNIKNDINVGFLIMDLVSIERDQIFRGLIYFLECKILKKNGN